MFYIQGTDGNTYKVVDTKTNNVRMCTLQQITDLVNQGIDIAGTKKATDGTVIVLCKSQNFLYDFARKVNNILAAMVLLQSNVDINTKINQVDKIAKEMGVLDKGDKLKIDLNAHTLMLPYQDMMMKYDAQGNYEFVSKTNMLSVTDDKVAEYSKLGLDAFNYIYLELAGKKYTMAHLTQLLQSVDSRFNPTDIVYIGITPSNRMFKFMMRDGWNIWSVKFDTVEKLRKEYPKIRDRVATQSNSFVRYAKEIAESSTKDKDDLAIFKVTLKNYDLNVYGLHAKYPTIHDVYFKQN